MKAQPDPLITLAEVASLLGFTRYRVQRLISGGLLKEIPRPGLLKPGYRKGDVVALKTKLTHDAAAA